MEMTPARRVTLLVCVPVALALIGWTGLSLAASVGTGNYQFSTPLTVRGGTLSVNVSEGQVTLVPGSSARLAGSVEYSLVRPSVTIGPSGMSFQCRVPAGVCSMSSTLTVPPGTKVDLSTLAGDLTVNGGTGGDITLSSDAGDISASGLTADRVTAQSGAGDVVLRFAQVPDVVRVSSSVGDVTVELPPGSTTYHVEGGSEVGAFSYPPGLSNPSSPHVIDASSDVGDVTISAG